ncbi:MULTISPECIES: hypothetical protein [Desulfobacula]|uniref:Conserved uncharacterized protein n=2 Tax=Desulfobacula TaxID=28222 RepID=K0NAF5_DESTT|nr:MULTISPECIES: hypothetical protein [Desulfobacula]CCK81019.1 conserved uncharacterized protein [Desulfobacula toluolica Tol2]SDT84908.1 hypothetical protein SAMN04487931_101434 [Desulfobacula phenolica]
MHEFLILNEESLPFKTKIDANNHLIHFFQVVKVAFQARVSPIRVSEQFDSHWYNILLSDNYFLREWIKNQDRDYSMRIKSLISSTDIPQIPIDDINCVDHFKLSEFCLASDNTVKTPSLGAAFMLDAVAVSFLSSDLWDLSGIALLWDTIDENGEIEKKKCVAKNAARVEHWKRHFEQLQEQRKESSRKGTLLWDKRNIEFSNLIFCNDCKKNFTNLSINRANYNQLWNNLKLLNDNISECNSDKKLKKLTQLNFTDESSRVKEK